MYSLAETFSLLITIGISNVLLLPAFFNTKLLVIIDDICVLLYLMEKILAECTLDM